MTYEKLLQELEPYGARLCAVSKRRSPEQITRLYQAGQRIFGENRPQELRDKRPLLPEDIQWHLIGHLQRNKIKYVVGKTALIHSIDSFKLLREVDQRAAREEVVQDCLLQIHIARETAKLGFHEDELLQMLQSPDFHALSHVRICGLMGMATFTDDREQIRREFSGLRQMMERLKQAHFSSREHFRELSMGMSGDYRIALDEGSTIVRIGSLLFERPDSEG